MDGEPLAFSLKTNNSSPNPAPLSSRANALYPASSDTTYDVPVHHYGTVAADAEVVTEDANIDGLSAMADRDGVLIAVDAHEALAVDRPRERPMNAKGTVDQRLFRLAFLLFASDDAVAHEAQIWRKESHSNAIN